jgi:hypothetical protein
MDGQIMQHIRNRSAYKVLAGKSEKETTWKILA